MSKSLHIIHLSDLHIDPDNPGESRPVFGNLRKKLESFREEQGIEFDLLIISGDLVDKGAENYEPVKEILQNIISGIELSPGCVFIVPGNHDIAWDCCPGNHSGIVEQIKKDPGQYMKPNISPVLSPGFKAYQDFAKGFPLLDQNSFDLPGLAQADIEISNIPIRLCGLNTAIVAGPDDSGKPDDKLKDRVAGLNLLWEMLDTRGIEKRLNLVVSHYPLSWINQKEQEEIQERLQDKGAIFLHGHIHHPKVDITGIVPNARLLCIGVGSIYGEKWKGRNQCQIIELDSNNSYPLLYEWFWFGNYGWRGFEPIQLGWEGWKLFSKPVSNQSIAKQCREAGLVNIGNHRTGTRRTEYCEDVLEAVAEDSELIIVGRSLIDWSTLYKEIEKSIEHKKLHVKLALLDENSEPWVETPIPMDWAMRDVSLSMECFRRIKVKPDKGSLEVYGLPFYVSHSFVSYNNKDDNKRHCLQEVGMALGKDKRPFVEFETVSEDSYAASLEWMYGSLMTEERLLFSNDGKLEERDTRDRAKIIVPKVKDLGLVDIAVALKNIDWSVADRGIEEAIRRTPQDGEIFIVGRSLIAWFQVFRYEKLVEAIVNKRVKCTFVIADPTDKNLRSLVPGDYAWPDLDRVWRRINEGMKARFEAFCRKQSVNKEQIGCFELYGIPAYVPVTFASFTVKGGVRYCTLDIGIGVVPPKRPVLCFQEVSDGDIYSRLVEIYQGILHSTEPLMFRTDSKFGNNPEGNVTPRDFQRVFMEGSEEHKILLSDNITVSGQRQEGNWLITDRDTSIKYDAKRYGQQLEVHYERIPLMRFPEKCQK